MSAHKNFFKNEWLDFLYWVVALILILTTCIIIFQSRHWSMLLDSPIYHYIAWLMTNGAVPYKDIFDQNFPGTFYLHFLVIKLLGSSDASFRLFDLLWLGITNLYIFLYCRKFGVLPAVWALALYSSYHITNGPLYSGQRDYLMVLFMVAAGYHVASAIEHGVSTVSLFFAGIFLGCAFMIKPHAGFFFVLLFLIIAIYSYRLRKEYVRQNVFFSIGFLVVPVLILCVLTVKGGLFPFIDIVLNYLIPIYSKLTRVPLAYSLLRYKLFGIYFIVLVIITYTVGTLVMFRHRHLSIRQIILLAGVTYGVFHYLSQGRGWDYHMYPMVAFTIMMATMWIKQKHIKKYFILYSFSVLLFFYISTVFIVKNIYIIHRPLDFNLSQVYALENDITDHFSSVTTVQALDYSGLTPLTFFRLKYPLATRFVLTFHLFNHIDEPYIQKLRTEFIKKLKENPPDMLVVCKDSWDIKNYVYLETFSELNDFINASYKIVVERDSYKIYILAQKAAATLKMPVMR